jgi:hypothetical protein
VAKFDGGGGGVRSNSKSTVDRGGHDSSEEDGPLFRCNIGADHSLRSRASTIDRCNSRRRKIRTDYTISRQACHKAFKKAIAREPTLAVDELRKLDNSRSEELFFNLQPSIRKGNPRAVEVGIKLLDHSARINGYGAAQRHELTGKDGKPLTLVQLLEVAGPISDENKE